MNPNFYHWHARAELKPDPSILEARWNAAAKFAEKLTSPDILSLIRLVLFTGAEPEFAKRFTSSLVKTEPTFPLDNNAELLRVMAAAAAWSRLENSSHVADAFALGFQSASFPQSRVEPVCPDVLVRATQYLAKKSEDVRPAIYAGAIEKAEKQADAHFTALKKAVTDNVPAEIGKATEALGRGVLNAIKESHERLGQVIGRLSEESQFLWWLTGRWSSSLKLRREKLTIEAYALPAAAEAAERVIHLPPAASTESLLDEALSQCDKKGRDHLSLLDLVHASDVAWAQTMPSNAAAAEFTPLVTLLSERRQPGKPDSNSLKLLKIPVKAKTTPAEASRQFLRELMFLRAMAKAA